MAFTDNFGHLKGLLGRLMLVSMDKEHLPMAEWGFTQFDMPTVFPPVTGLCTKRGKVWI